MSKRTTDPIPEKFDSPEEAGEFWDAHDATDYADSLEPVHAITQLKNRYFEVEVDMALAQALREKARERGITTNDLATEMLRQQLAA